MRKIMFNDKYGLTASVLAGAKTQTRRIINAMPKPLIGYGTEDKAGYVHLIDGYTIVAASRYRLGEVVAVAQNYLEATKEFNRLGDMVGWGKMIANTVNACAGYSNKMFVRADLMPHHIRIDDVRVERLQDISDEDVYKEGFTNEPVNNGWGNFAHHDEAVLVYYDRLGRSEEIRSRYPREAFAALIDKVSGNGTWERNPWVFVYTFELID